MSNDDDNLRLLDPHCQDVVECLENLLARARAGEVAGFFYGYWEDKGRAGPQGGNTITGLAGRGNIKELFFAIDCWKFDWFAFLGDKGARDGRKGPQGSDEPEGDDDD